MELIKTDRDAATVKLTKSELVILANALNESREAIEAWEFSTRMGAEPAEAERLRQQLSTLLDSLDEANS